MWHVLIVQVFSSGEKSRRARRHEPEYLSRHNGACLKHGASACALGLSAKKSLNTSIQYITTQTSGANAPADQTVAVVCRNWSSRTRQWLEAWADRHRLMENLRPRALVDCQRQG